MKRKEIYFFLIFWMIFTASTVHGYNPNVIFGIGRELSLMVMIIYLPYVVVIHFYYNEKYEKELKEYGYLKILQKKSKSSFINKIFRDVILEVACIVIVQMSYFFLVFGNQYDLETTMKMLLLYFLGMIVMVWLQIFWELILNKGTSLIFILGYYCASFLISIILYGRAREYIEVIYLLIPSYMQGGFSNLIHVQDVNLNYGIFVILIVIYGLSIYGGLQYMFKRKDII